MKRRYIFVRMALVFCLFSYTCGCTFTHDIHAEPSLANLPVIEKLPVKAGVYYSTEFSKYEHVRIYGANKYVVYMGADSVDYLNKVLPTIFERVEEVKSLPPYEKGDNDIAFVIEPFIDSFNFRVGFESLSEEFHVAYRFSLYGPDGSFLKTWKIIGKPEDEKRSTLMPYNHIDFDMEDALNKLVSSFGVGSPLRTEVLAKLEDPQLDDEQKGFSDGIKIIAKPFKETFSLGEEESFLLTDYGVVAIEVTINNLSQDVITVDDTAFHLVLSDGKSIPPSGISGISSRLEKRSYVGDATAIFLGPLVSTIVTVNEESTKKAYRKSVERQLQNISLHNTELAPGQTARGLIFFVPSTDTKGFNNANLVSWFASKDTKSFRRECLVDGVEYTASRKNND